MSKSEYLKFPKGLCARRTDIAKRICLGCNETFKSLSRFDRLCDRCGNKRGAKVYRLVMSGGGAVKDMFQ